jgi:hypothetical protein
VNDDASDTGIGFGVLVCFVFVALVGGCYLWGG